MNFQYPSILRQGNFNWKTSHLFKLGLVVRVGCRGEFSRNWFDIHPRWNLHQSAVGDIEICSTKYQSIDDEDCPLLRGASYATTTEDEEQQRASQ
jgi:hypothetical protein